MFRDQTTAEAQLKLRLMVGNQVYDSLPDAPPQKALRPHGEGRGRAPRAEARHRLVLSGHLPPAVGCGFTPAECAVLAIIAIEQKRFGRCTLTLAEIGRRARACRTTTKNALHWAERRGLVTIERRRLDRNRNAPNIVVIVDRRWVAWIRLGPRVPRIWGGGRPVDSGLKGVGSFSQPEPPYNFRKGVADKGTSGDSDLKFNGLGRRMQRRAET